MSNHKDLVKAQKEPHLLLASFCVLSLLLSLK